MKLETFTSIFLYKNLCEFVIHLSSFTIQFGTRSKEQAQNSETVVCLARVHQDTLTAILTLLVHYDSRHDMIQTISYIQTKELF